MPRDGAIIFSDLVGWLDVLRISCEKCGREGRYPLDALIDRRGRDGKIIDWLDEVTAECPKKIARDMNGPCEARCQDLPRALSGRAISHDTLLLVLIPLFLAVVAALVIKDVKPLAIEGKPLAMEDKASVAEAEHANHAGPQTDDSNDKRGLTPDCEKELRRAPDLLRYFANRIQTGEDIQSVVADMRLQEKKISEVCD